MPPQCSLWRRQTQSLLSRAFLRASSTSASTSTVTATATASKSKPQSKTSPNPSPKEPVKVVATDLAFHWETFPSNRHDRNHAESWFTKHPAVSLFIAGELYQVPFTSVPEVAFMGRSNVGKSSLLNAIMDTKLCRTSANPGRTRAMHAYGVGGQDSAGNKGRITILDMPGYGKGSRQEWGRQVEKYLSKRKELKRVFLMVDALHGLKESDKIFLSLLRNSAIPHQVILSKVDRVLISNPKARNINPESLKEGFERLKGIVEGLKQEIQPKGEGPPALGEILACSTELGKWKDISSEPRGMMGVNAIRSAVLAASGFSRGKKQPLKTVDLEQEDNTAQRHFDSSGLEYT